jgi:hypothetical protein
LEALDFPVHRRGYHGLLLRNITVIDFICSAVSWSEGHRNLVSAEEELQISIERLSGHWYPHCEEEGSVFVFVTDIKNPLTSGMLLIVLHHVWCGMIDGNIRFFAKVWFLT